MLIGSAALGSREKPGVVFSSQPHTGAPREIESAKSTSLVSPEFVRSATRHVLLPNESMGDIVEERNRLLCAAVEEQLKLTNEEPAKSIIDIIAQSLEVGREKITLNSRLNEDLGATSDTRMELMLDLDDKCHLNMSEVTMNGFITVGDVVNYVTKQMQINSEEDFKDSLWFDKTKK